MLEIKNLKKTYGNKTILDIESLFIDEGIIHLKGINGSGKTTFSKIVAGLIPFEGEVILAGTLSPNKTKLKYRKLVNYSDSEPNYPDFLTANDLISFVGKAKGASKEDQLSLQTEFGMNEYVYDQIGTYSSGMLKRLSLCLAFLGTPSLILLDEPFNTLDVEAIQALRNMIETHQDKGVNFILVSHQDVRELEVPVHSSFIVENHTIRKA